MCARSRSPSSGVMCSVQNKLLDTIQTERAVRDPAVGLDCQRKAKPPNRWTTRFESRPFWTALDRSQCVDRDLAKGGHLPRQPQGLARASHPRQEREEGRSLERKGPSHISRLARTVDHRMQKSRTRTHNQTDTTRPNETIAQGPTPELTCVADGQTNTGYGSKRSLECLKRVPLCRFVS